MMKKAFFFSVILSAAFLLQAEVPLMKNGSPQCVIIPAAKDPTSLHAANELALYLGKIGKGTAPAVSDKAVPGKSSVIFSLVKDPAIREHGFAFETKEKILYIKAVKPVGLLFGAYQLLKDHTGIRWLYPGREGEFYTVKKNITIPDMKKISNPSFKVRTFHFCCSDIDHLESEVYDWMVRNNMNIEMDFHQTKHRKHVDFLAKRGATLRGGWHCFTRLHNGINTASSGKECIAAYKKMFQEHPERFPLINGKRRYLERQRYQPCTTNADNIRIVADNLVKEIRARGMDKLGGRYIMVANDNTSPEWCECANCKAADTPEEAKKGMVSTRYWKFINAVTALARKEIPDLPAVGYSYHNYKIPPTGVKADPRMPVMLSYNDKCYRHKLQDPNCEINKRYYSLYKAWGKMSPGKVYTWEEVSQNGMDYQPNELIYAEHLKEYYRLGIRGTTPSIPPLFSKFVPPYDKKKIRMCWYGMWQTLYLAALVQWDVNTDAVKALEEANAIYYGAAWKNGMKEYRKLLTEASVSAPGCFGYSLNAILGRNLVKPGVEAKLLKYLDQAEKAAKDDARTLALVKRERMFFEEIWVEQHRLFVKNYKEMRSFPRTGTIRIDGKLDEPAWNRTDIVGNFMVSSKKTAAHQSAVRVLYDPEYLYVSMEMMENAMKKLRSIHTKRDSEVWNDNSIELFLNHPNMGSMYYHIIINDKGTIRDALFGNGVQDVSFDCKALLAVGKYADRWIVEMKIPTSALGRKITAGDTWRINVQRYRVVDGEKPEGSSMTMGAGHGVASFMPIAFASRWQGRKDTRHWRNSNMNEKQTVKLSPKSKWKLKNDQVPAYWNLGIYPGELSMETKEKDPQDIYLKMKRGNIYQLHKGKQKKLQIILEAKGEGTLRVDVYRFTRTAKGDSGNQIGSDNLMKIQLTDTWKTYKVIYTKHSADEVLGIALHHSQGEEACIDNFFVVPEE